MSTNSPSFQPLPMNQPVHSLHTSPPSHLQPPSQDELPAEQHEEAPPYDDEIPYPEPSSEQTLLPPPSFKPFFTLIEDVSSGEYYHPYMHYVFADDDPIMVTAASMRSLGLDDTKYLPSVSLEGQPITDDNDDDDNDDNDNNNNNNDNDVQVESPLPPPIPGVREHYLIIDVGADGRSIIDAKSLSSTWQTTKVSVRATPSFDENELDQGFMMQIEGMNMASRSKSKDKSRRGDAKLNEARERSQGDVFEALEGLVQGIEGALELAGNIAAKGLKESAEVEGANASYDLEGTR